MNDLNTVLLEGTCTDTGRYFDTLKVFTFTIQSKVFEQTLEAFIKVKGERAVKIAKQKIRKGRKVRIVGRLVPCHNSMCILADNVEYKPEVKK